MCNLAADTRIDGSEYCERVDSGSALNFRSDEVVVPSVASIASKEKPIMGIWRTFALTVAVLSFATSANAGVQMYSAELIMHTRGSDAAGNFVAIPFGANCNTGPYHVEQTHMLTTSSMGVYTLTIPKFGGQVPVIDTNADSIPDVASGCAPASLQVGLPLSGSGSLATTGSASTARTASNPRGFTMPRSGISRVASGASFLETSWIPLSNGTTLFDFEIEYADLKNDAGGFANGGGPGSFTVSHGARVHATAGANRFGGTMRLLGEYRTNRGINTPASKSVGDTTWNLRYIGAGAATVGGDVTGGLTYTAMTYRTWINLGSFDYSARTATISVFPWTTGAVEVTATGGPQSTVLKRTGYDNRTPGGAGNIQMVSPSLTHWKNPLSDYYTGSIATIKLTFIPEPDAWMMLVSGIGTLAILYRVNGRHQRA
jgi:hypothetical protein